MSGAEAQCTAPASAPRSAPSLLLADPGWPLQVLELALRGMMAEAHDNQLDSNDMERMTEPLFALAYDARRAAAAREAGL